MLRPIDGLLDPEELGFYVTDADGFAPIDGPFATYEEAFEAARNQLRSKRWCDRIFIDWFDFDTMTQKSWEVLEA